MQIDIKNMLVTNACFQKKMSPKVLNIFWQSNIFVGCVFFIHPVEVARIMMDCRNLRKRW